MTPYPKHPRKVDKKYLAFIRKQPCLVCRDYLSDPHHPKHTKYGGELGKNIKPDDKKAIPLCRTHHAIQENIGEERFYKKYNINPLEEIKRLNAKYEQINIKPISH
jgi:hypothetical protein